VRPWPVISTLSDTVDLSARRQLLSEALVPVSRTSDWLGRIEVLRKNGGSDIFTRAMEGLSLIEARTDDDEALAIALIMRETLETEGPCRDGIFMSICPKGACSQKRLWGCF